MRSFTTTKQCSISKSGLACLWENGGGMTNTGNAEIITDANGNPKRAIYVRKHGDLACKDHALIPVRVGDCVLTANRHWNQYAFTVQRIVSIDGDTASLAATDDPICLAAYNAAVDKMNDYHCRRPHYIRNIEQFFSQGCG